MQTQCSLVIFHLDEKRYAIASDKIKRIIRAVEITAMPNKSKKILGIINLHGTIITVLDLRQLLDLPSTTLGVNDYIIIMKNSEQNIAFIVNQVNFIEAELSDIISIKKTVHSNLEFSDKVLKDPEGPINFLDIDQLTRKASE
jgi:purine-binding chemotaxis protein CheW